MRLAVLKMRRKQLAAAMRLSPWQLANRLKGQPPFNLGELEALAAALHRDTYPCTVADLIAEPPERREDADDADDARHGVVIADNGTRNR